MKRGFFVPLGWFKTAALLLWYMCVWPTIIWFGVIQFYPEKWLQIAAPLWIVYSGLITVALVMNQVQAGGNQKVATQPQQQQRGA